jgi:hypothetical protein
MSSENSLMLDKPAPTNTPISKESPEYKQLLAQFADRNWRINNLYFVLDEDGKKVRYRRRPAQLKYAQDAWLLDIIVKARQLGFSTEIAIDITDLCVFKKNITAGIIDATLNDAKKKLQKVKVAYQGLPERVRHTVTMTKDNEEEIWFSNGSSVEVGTTHRGGTLQYLHISEFGKIAAEKPDQAREIITGALNTLSAGQQVKIESTAHGTSGAFYDMVQRAEKLQKEKRPLTALDFKLHFFAWWMDPKYRLPAASVPISNEMKEYFAELRTKYAIPLNAEQMAWYVSKHISMGDDDMKSEFPSHIEETFFNSLEGTWFKKEMTKAREERRIGWPIPHDPSRPVNTFWDIGLGEKNDQNGIIFHQTDGVRHRIIDYHENFGEGIQHYAKVMQDKARERGFTYGQHFAPHDIDRQEWGSNARSRLTIAKELQIDFEVVPRVLDKEDAIEAARAMLNLTWIDNEHCQRLVDALDNYRKTWNKLLAQWTRKPLHNWASTGADCLMTGACGLKPDKVPSAARSRGEKRRGSQWAN